MCGRCSPITKPIIQAGALSYLVFRAGFVRDWLAFHDERAARHQLLGERLLLRWPSLLQPPRCWACCVCDIGELKAPTGSSHEAFCPPRRTGVEFAGDRVPRRSFLRRNLPRARWLFVKSPSRSIFLFEHDLFRKTGTHFSGSCSSGRCRSPTWNTRRTSVWVSLTRASSEEKSGASPARASTRRRSSPAVSGLNFSLTQSRRICVRS